MPDTISLQAPQGNAAVIDGTFSPGEWDGALRTNLTGGGELMLMHDDGYLYLGIRSRAMGFGSVCTADDNRVSILHSSAGLGTAIFERDGDDWRRIQQFSYCCWEATQIRLDQFLREEGWVASIGPKGIPEEMEYQIAMNGGSMTLALVYVDDFSFETALHWPENLDDDCLGLALIPENPPERLSFFPETWVTITAATVTSSPLPTPPFTTLDRVPISPENAHDVVQLWQVDMPGFLDLHETCGVAFSPDGTYLAAACRSTTIPLWDVASGQLVRTFGGGGYVWANVAFSPDGETLASSGQEGAISLWDVATGERLGKISDAPGYMSEVIYSPDGQLLAAGSFLGSALLWDANTNDTLFEFSEHRSRVNCVNFSPDGRLLVTGGGDNKARVWESSSGRETLVLSGATHFVEDVEFSPSGLQIVGASDNSRIYLWDAASGDLLLTLSGHRGPVNGVTYSPDGRMLASTSNDRTLRLWDADTGQNLVQLTGHTDLVIRAAFSPDGSLIASVGWDGTVRVWGLIEHDESRADGLTEAEVATLSSLEQVNDYPLYTMRHYGAYDRREVGAAAEPAWACSLFAALGDEQSMVYGRNFDWRYSPALLLFTDPPGGYASVSMVDIEYLVGAENVGRLTDLPLVERAALLDAPFWPFDGMNEHGLVIGMAAVPSGNVPPDPDKETVDSLLVMRRVLDEARDVDEAVAILQRYNIDWGGGPDLHYLVADRSGHSVLVEFYQGSIVLLPNPAGQPWYQATNFLRASVGESAAGTCWRYDHIGERLLEANGRLTSSSAMDLLTQVAQDNTQWSVVYGLSTGDVIVSMGQEYETQHVFRLDLAGEQ